MSGVSFKVSAETTQADARLAEINKTLLQIKGSAASVSSTISNAFKGIAASIGITGIALTLKAASDNAIQLENRMKTVAFDAGAVAAAMKSVRDLSLETRASVESTATLYQKYSKAAEQLATKSGDVLNVTRLTAQAIQLSGTSADSANAAVIQLGQGLASGTLRGEELNSVLEQAPRLAQAIAEGLGTTVGQLRTLGAAGKLTSEEVFSSLLSQSEKLNDEFARTTLTLTNQITNIKTAAGYFTSEALKGISTGAISALLDKFSTGVYNRADTIQAEVSNLVNAVTLKFNSVKGLVTGVVGVFGAIARSVGLALPVLTQSRTLFGDIANVARTVAGSIRNILDEPLRKLSIQSREMSIFLTSLFGALDFDVPKAMRALFDSRSLIEFNSALKQLSKGIDSNTEGMLSKLSAIPRNVKYFVQDTASYFGLFNKPFIRKGFFEPLFDSLNEIKEGFQNNVSWINRLTGSVTPLGKAVDGIRSILYNFSDILKAGFVASGAAIAGTITLTKYLFEILGQAARDFTDRNTFIDVFLASENKLQDALKNIKNFAEDVIETFKEIWDAVIGHSWWTDTIDSIIETSNSLWDKTSGGLNRFARNAKSMFRDIYEEHPGRDMFNAGKDSLLAGIKTLRVYVGDIEFVDLGNKIKDTLIQVFKNVRENYKDILETAGISLLFMGIVALFPSTALAQMISAKAILAIGIGMTLVSNHLISQITGGDPLGAIAVTMGEVLGRALYRFITNIPSILNAAIGVIVGLFKGFATQLPFVGGFFEAFLSIPAVGNILGLIGTVLFGKSAIALLGGLGLVKTSIKTVGTMLAGLFSMRSRVVGNGLIFSALFGPSEMAVIGGLLLINGAFDSLLGDSLIAKMIAGGGLFLLMLQGKLGFGHIVNRLFTDIKGIIKVIQASLLFLSSTWTGLWRLPALAADFTLWNKLVFALSAAWVRFKYLITTPPAVGFGNWFFKQAALVVGAIEWMKTRYASLTATGLGATLANNKKWVIGGIALAAGLYAGNANAEELGEDGKPLNPNLKTPEQSKGFFSSVKQSISDAIDYAISGFSYLAGKIGEYFLEIAVTLSIAGKALLAFGASTLSWFGATAGLAATLGTTWGALLAGLGSSILAIITAPVTLIIAAVVGISYLLFDMFAEGNTFIEKLENTVVDLKRLFGITPTKRVEESKAVLLKAFTPETLRTAASNDQFVDPEKFDFKGIYSENIAKSVQENYNIVTKSYARTLEKYRKEEMTAEGGTADTYKELIKQGALVTKAFEKLKTASSDLDPRDVVEKYWTARSQKKGFLEGIIPSYTAGIEQKGAAANLKITQFQTGIETSKQAKEISTELAKLEQRFNATRQIANAPISNKRELALAVADNLKAQEAITAFKKENNYKQSGTSESAKNAFERLKKSEDALSAANASMEAATNRIVQIGLSSNFGKPSYKDSEGFTVPADYNNFAQLINVAISTSDESTKKQITGMLLELTDLMKDNNWTAINGKPREQFVAKQKVSVATANVEEFLRKTVTDNEAASKIALYQASVKAAVKSEDLKVEIPAFLVLDENEQKTFKENLSKFKELEDAKWSANNRFDMLKAFRLKDLHDTTMKYEGEINMIRAMKGELAALGAVSKASGFEKQFDIASPRMLATGSTKLQADERLLANLKRNYESTVATAMTNVTDPAVESSYRQNYLDAIARQEAIVQAGYKEWMSPRDSVLFDAEQLGVTLGESVIKGLNKGNNVSLLQKSLDFLRGKQTALTNTPLPKNIADIPAANAEKDKRVAEFAAEQARQNKRFADASKLSAIFASIGIPFESLRVFKPADFNNAISFAKQLEIVSKSIEELGADADQATVSDLLKRKFDIMKNAADVALKYAYNSVEKVAQVISSIGIKGFNLTPAIADAAVSIDMLRTKLKNAAKEEKLGLIDVIKFQKELDMLARAEDYLKDMSSNTFGEQLERINSNLKLSISDLAFSEMDDAFREKLNNFANYYKQAKAAINEGRPVEGGTAAMLKTLENGLRSLKFISIFEGFGQKISDSMLLSAKGQLSTIKSLTDFDIDPDTFNKSSRASRDDLTGKVLYLDALEKMQTEPSLIANDGIKSVLGKINPANTLGELKSIFDEAMKLAEGISPEYTKKQIAAMIGLPEHMLNLGMTIKALDDTIKETQLTNRPAGVGKLSGDGLIGGTKEEIFERLVAAIAVKENATGNPRATSHKGAIGPMQMMPDTFAEYKQSKNADIYNYDDNMAAGRAYLKKLWGIFDGDIRKIAAGYHAGPGRIPKDGEIPLWLDDTRKGKNDKRRGLDGIRTIDYANDIEIQVLGKSSRPSILALDEPSKVSNIAAKTVEPIKAQILNPEFQISPNGQLERIAEGIQRVYDKLDPRRLDLPEAPAAFAKGGSVWGAGTTTSDSIPAVLSNREFVVKASAADRYRDLLEQMNSGEVAHFDMGGSVDLSRHNFLKVNTAKAMVSQSSFVRNNLPGADKAESYLLEEIKKTINPKVNKAMFDPKFPKSMQSKLDSIIMTRAAAVAPSLLRVIPSLSKINWAVQGISSAWSVGNELLGPMLKEWIDSKIRGSSGQDNLGFEIYEFEQYLRERIANSMAERSSANMSNIADTGLSFATGGSVWGAGTATSDSIPAMLSNGEFVVNAKAAKEYRGLLARINSGNVAKLQEGGPANGSSLSQGTLGNGTYFLADPTVLTTAIAKLVPSVDQLNASTIATRKAFEANYIAQLDEAPKIVEQLRKFGNTTASKLDIAQLPPEKMGVVKTLMSKVKIEDKNTNDPLKAKEYQEALADLNAYVEGFVSSLKNLSRAAGAAMQQTNQQALAGMLQTSLSGADSEGGGLTISKVIGGFAKSITDTVATSFTQNLVGESSPIGMAISGLGKSLVDSVTKAFSPSADGGMDWSGMIKTGLAFFGMADGGFVKGSGSATSDSIPTMLSNGEFVVNAKATKEYRDLLARINSGKMPKFAAGGIVGDFDMPIASGIELNKVYTASPQRNGKSTSVFNINVTGDVSQQTRREIQQMIPQIATGVNMHNYEQGSRR